MLALRQPSTSWAQSHDYLYWPTPTISLKMWLSINLSSHIYTLVGQANCIKWRGTIFCIIQASGKVPNPFPKCSPDSIRSPSISKKKRSKSQPQRIQPSSDLVSIFLLPSPSYMHSQCLHNNYINDFIPCTIQVDDAGDSEPRWGSFSKSAAPPSSFPCSKNQVNTSYQDDFYVNKF